MQLRVRLELEVGERHVVLRLEREQQRPVALDLREEVWVAPERVERRVGRLRVVGE